ncbi:MAG: sigma-70 family RNA polymerase sigma factor [Armatimonadetes bacterium]|nr:sigma-70 family RNA polymerase sigma factor [Armatimonadota bacterium]
MGTPDRELMRRVQQGDTHAFEDFVRRHDRTLSLHLRRYVGPDDASDLRQEVLLRVWERAHQWEGRGSPLAWMLRIATNLALNHLRARRETMPLEGPADDEGEPSGESGDTIPIGYDPIGSCPRVPRDDFERWETASRLAELMGEMPEDKRAVLGMARLEGLRLQEIADQLEVPLGTVKSRLHAATQWLADRWEEE